MNGRLEALDTGHQGFKVTRLHFFAAKDDLKSLQKQMAALKEEHRAVAKAGWLLGMARYDWCHLVSWNQARNEMIFYSGWKTSRRKCVLPKSCGIWTWKLY